MSSLFSQINQSHSILLVCHRNPDADTFGAAAGLAFFINEKKDKKAGIYCVDQFPAAVNFINAEKFVLPAAAPRLADFDLIICLDCADWSQTGLPEEFLSAQEKIPLVNIDHHQTNTQYANLNIVQAASATAEIIYRLFAEQSINFGKEIATALLAGIITDTTYFTNASTTKESMAIASELMKRGANIKAIISHTWKKNSPEALKIWGKILSQLEFNPKYKIVTAVISKEDSVAPEVFEGLANFLTTLYEANIILVIRETDDNILKCSLRTTKDEIDVSRLAQKFGGGGHAKAAGFSLRGRLQKTVNGWAVTT